MRKKKRETERKEEEEETERRSGSFFADRPHPSTPETDSRPVVLNFLIVATL